MKFYVSKTHDKLNRKPFRPELICENICLNPLYKASLSRPANVLLDSGAFQDVKTQHRLSFQKALQRQLDFEDEQNFTSELIVSYDRLIDEKFDKQIGQIKRRVSHQTAEKYIEETIEAAKFLADERKDLNPRKLILSNQGITVFQYLRCIKKTLKFAEKTDIIGYGGFCIVGLKPKYKKQYFRVLEKSLPLIKKKGIKRIHIFGIGVFPILVKTHFLCRKYGIEPSYDTSSYEFNGIMGRLYNPQNCTKNPFELPKVVLSQTYDKKDKYISYHPVKAAYLNIRLINDFWETINESKIV